VSEFKTLYSKHLFYALAVFLKKLAQIKNDIPIRNNRIGKGQHNRVQPAKAH